MIRHIVMWKLRGPSEPEKRAQSERVRAALHGLRGNIPGMLELEVGLRSGAVEEQLADVVLITGHESWDALAVYLAHPAHQQVAALIGELRTERRVIDFEVA
jgi:hypothetical protein